MNASTVELTRLFYSHIFISFLRLHSKSLDGDVSPKPNGASIELTRASFFTKIDVLSDGSNEDKEAAMRIMHDNESLVSISDFMN